MECDLPYARRAPVEVERAVGVEVEQRTGVDGRWGGNALDHERQRTALRVLGLQLVVVGSVDPESGIAAIGRRRTGHLEGQRGGVGLDRRRAVVVVDDL